MGQYTHFSQVNIVEEIFLGLGSQIGEDLWEEWIQGLSFCFDFQPSL